MPMSPEIKGLLSEERLSPLHKALLDQLQQWLRPSRSRMQELYGDWDARADAYMKRRPITKEDAEAIKQGLPKKTSLPLSYSQINSFVAVGFMLFTQRDRFFELQPTEDQDQVMRECCELVLQRDQLATGYKTRLVQNLLNVGRFGLGCEIDWWEVDKVWLPIDEVVPASMLNGQPTGEPTVVSKLTQVTKREGTNIRTISPYRVFFDSGFHITEWQRGNFVAWDDEYTRNSLLTLEQSGTIVGVQHIKPYDQSSYVQANRGKARFAGIDYANLQKQSTICITQVVANVIPSEIKGTDGQVLGKDTVPHKWLFWIANDSRVVRAEPLNSLHADWPLSTSFFAPDQHEATFNSLAYMVDEMQSLVSWLMNSRMAAVGRTIDNQFVVDPRYINVDDIVTRKRLLRVTKEGSGKDLNRHFHQIAVTDTTTGHVADMQNLTSLMQMVSGVNDNVMGQYNEGRRSATEARAVTSAASSRLKLVYDVMWNQHYQPQARRSLINARQAMSPEEFVAVCGQQKLAYFQQFRATPQELVRSYDYVAFDGTLPSEKLFLAQQLQELQALLLGNPTVALTFNLDPNKIQKEIMELRGMGRGANFAFDQAELQRMIAMQQASAAGQPEPQPQ